MKHYSLVFIFFKVFVSPSGLCFVSSFTHAGLIFSGIREPLGVVVADSLVLRNRQLLVAATPELL